VLGSVTSNTTVAASSCECGAADVSWALIANFPHYQETGNREKQASEGVEHGFRAAVPRNRVWLTPAGAAL
jgi:hypothetical protein